MYQPQLVKDASRCCSYLDHDVFKSIPKQLVYYLGDGLALKILCLSSAQPERRQVVCAMNTTAVCAFSSSGDETVKGCASLP